MGFKPISGDTSKTSLFGQKSPNAFYNYLAQMPRNTALLDAPKKAGRVRRQRFTRKIDKSLSRHVKRYSTLVGEILWAWNTLHGFLANCFLLLSQDNETGLAIWHCMKTDNGQREAFRAALGAQRKRIPDRIIDEIEWLLELVDKLSQHRNDVVHVPMTYLKPMDVLVPDYKTGDPKRADRLNRHDRERFHKQFKGDLVQIAYYAQFLMHKLVVPTIGPGPWPERPLLLSIPRAEIPLTRSQKLRRKATGKQRPRRKSSRR